MNCPLCDNLLNSRMDKVYFLCTLCKGIVRDKLFYVSKELEKLRYESHNNNVNDLAFQKFISPITNYVLTHFKQHHKGLDFGSGTAPVITKVLRDHEYQIEPYDLFFLPDASVFQSKYDYIVSCEVFEHLWQPKKEIERLYHLLNKNGQLLIFTLLYNSDINFSNWVYRNDDTHVFIFQKETFEYLARQFKYDLEFLSNRFMVLKKQ